jgi:D-beta-D-heptose 7-phosphate kinase/D-beta-D-heptose 1-phosphate adenosyltransferase
VNKVVFTNGCFDILHKGHIELLKFCKSLGNTVVVGVNSDKSVKRLKGESRPINSQEDRRDILKAIRYVDHVFVFEEDTPYNLIKKTQPDIIVKGGDYKKQDVIGADLCEVIIFDYLDGYSTTETVQCIISGR